MILKMIKKILNKFKKKRHHINLGKCGIVEPTKPAMEFGIDNKYNRKIVIYSSIVVRNNLVQYGKILEEIPYTEEEAKNLIKIKKIPLAIRKINNDVPIENGSAFGEIIN